MKIRCLLGLHRWHYKASYGWCERHCGAGASVVGIDGDRFIWDKWGWRGK